MNLRYLFRGACLLLTFLLSNSLSAQTLNRVQGDVLIRLSPEANVRDLGSQLREFQGHPTHIEIVDKVSKVMNVWLLHYDFTTINEYEFLDFLRRQSAIEVAQFNHLVKDRSTIPDDPQFGNQWQWLNPGGGGAMADSDVDADEAWDITTGGTTANGDDIVVCVVEGGGANINHPDLAANSWVNEAEIPDNNIDDDGNGFVDDYLGWNPQANNDNIPGGNHGTAVSGMIGAVGDNTLGITGINWRVKIMQVVLPNVTEAGVLQAYEYPYEMRKLYNDSDGAEGAFVVAVNSSWGIDGGDPEDAPIWCAYYDTMGEEGILNCGATANVNWNIDVQGDLPTACPSQYMISVTATDDSDVRTFSAYGVVNVDLGAPGDNIFSLTTNGYGFTSGTSFASPLTAGVIALMYSAPCSNLANLALDDPALAAQMVRDYLFQGVDVVPNLVGEVATGGRVNAFNSIQLILDNCGPCPAPSGLTASDVTDTEASLSWNSSDSTLTTDLRWREVGAADWTDVFGATSPFALVDLNACTEYEFQLQDICAADSSGYTSSFVFKTDGCCEPPKEVLVEVLGETEVSVIWESILAAETYTVMLDCGDGPVLYEGLVDTVLLIDGLTPCSSCEVSVQTVCQSGETTDFSEVVPFNVPGCGACTDFDYCAVNGATDFEYIQAVSIGDLDNNSGDDNGYGDYTGPGTELAIGFSYEITLTPGFTGQSYDENFRVWIDYNLDGDFNDAGELAYDAPNATDAAITGMINIPATATPGLTRMRVGMSYGGFTGNTEPGVCDTNTEGEYEDYCVLLTIDNPPCVYPTGISAEAPDYFSLIVSWEEIGTATGYNAEYRPVGTTDWIPLNAIGLSVTIEDLEPCESYEFHIQSVCDDEFSDFSPTVVFTLPCPPDCSDVPTGLDTMVVDETAATVMWNGTLNALMYKVRMKEVTGANWMEFDTDETNYSFVGLTDCTEYEFQVQAICDGPDNASSYSDSDLFSTDCSVGIDEVLGRRLSARVFPNPFGQQFDLQLSLDDASAVQVDLLNAAGQKLQSRQYDLGAGSQTVSFDRLNELAAGLYFVKVQAGERSTLLKVVKE